MKLDDKILDYLGFKFYRFVRALSSGQPATVYRNDKECAWLFVVTNDEFYEYRKIMEHPSKNSIGLISCTYDNFCKDYSDLIRDYKINQIL